MAESRAQSASSYKPIRAPRGPELSCKGWQQEASLRLLMNSVDPAIAENPQELIVSGGIGKVARDWQAFHAIANSLQALADDETLLIYDGEPGPILKTNLDLPRVLVVNSTLPPPEQAAPSATNERATPGQMTRFASDWMFTGPASVLPEAYEALRALADKLFGGSLAGRLVVAAGMGGMGGALALAATLNGAAFLGIDAHAERIKRHVKTGYCEVMVNDLDEALRILKNAVRKREPASVGLIAHPAELLPTLARRGVLPDLLTDQTYADEPYIPPGLTTAQALESSEKDPRAYVEKALDSIAAQFRGMLELKKMGSLIFVFGNEMEAHALARSAAEPNEMPNVISDYLAPDLARGRGPLTIVALSGDPGDLTRVDDLIRTLFPDGELREWIAIARRHPSPGLPARSCLIGRDEAVQLGAAINDLVAQGAIKAPVAMGRSIRQTEGGNPLASQPLAHAANPQASVQGLADSPQLAALLHSARGASWLSVQEAAEPAQGHEPRAAFIVIDGKPNTAEHVERFFAKDFAF
jgi:urocanate hydratase